MNTYRTTARIVGVLFLAGMFAGVGGNILIQTILNAPEGLRAVSANTMGVAIGAVLLLLTVAGDVAHGFLLFPLLRKHSESMALGYFGFRIVDGVFLGIQVLFVLLQIPLAGQYLNVGVAEMLRLQGLSALFIQVNLQAYHIAMFTLGIAGVMLCVMFFRTRLLPRFLSVWGIVGYATILCGSVLEVMGFALHSLDTIPGGLWELFIGVWLIVKGFNLKGE